MITTEKEIMHKQIAVHASEAAEQYIAALYRQLTILDVLTEMEKIQEILSLIRTIRETMIIIHAPASSPAHADIPAYAAETMVVPAISLPQLSFNSAGYPVREVQ